MLDKLTEQLFGRFPREVGLYRNVVNNIEQFRNYVIHKNGIEDIYTSLYPLNFLVDKLFFDNDWGSFVLQDSQKLCETCLDEGFKQVVPVVSGKKGFHLYPVLKPEIHGAQAKIRILRAQYYLIEKAFGEFRAETKLIHGRDVHMFVTKDRIIAPDPAICGDVRRITRVPNTLRPPENINYCTYIPLDEFLDMTELDVIEYMKVTHSPKISLNYRKAPKLESFHYEFDNCPTFSTPVPSEFSSAYDDKYLKGLLRPCLYRHIVGIHPNNYVRYAATLELLHIGMTIDDIVATYSGLGWEDFNENKTRRHVEILERKMKSEPNIYHNVPCNTLRYKGIPTYCCEATG